MKKKIKIAVALLIVLAIIILPTLWLTNCFTQNRLTSKLYRPDNVYEEIWNLVVSEQFGTPTVLTTSTEGAYAHYGLGEFEQVNIPELDMAVLWMYDPHKLLEFFFKTDEGYVMFVYDYETKTLYGEEQPEFLMENFLKYYLEWNKEETKYTPDNLGNASFKYVDNVFGREW